MYFVFTTVIAKQLYMFLTGQLINRLSHVIVTFNVDRDVSPSYFHGFKGATSRYFSVFLKS